MKLGLARTEENVVDNMSTLRLCKNCSARRSEVDSTLRYERVAIASCLIRPLHPQGPPL